MTDKNRIPIADLDWFKDSGVLAIADVVYVKGIGICSHQPGPRLAKGTHRMMDVRRDYHYVSDDRLFQIESIEERMRYWNELTELGIDS